MLTTDDELSNNASDGGTFLLIGRFVNVDPVYILR